MRYGVGINVMSMTGTFDIAAARETLARRDADRRKRFLAMAKDAQRDFERIVEMLVKKYRPKHIYQWGSLLKPERFSDRSDIDIAVEGLDDPLAGLHALDDACALTRFPVDLVEMERIHPAHAATIREEGKLVHECTS